jgi:hypothetical protein
MLLAGFYAADGSAAAAGGGFQLRISQVHRSILEFFRARFGGSVVIENARPAGRRLTPWRWCLCGGPAEDLAREILTILEVAYPEKSDTLRRHLLIGRRIRPSEHPVTGPTERPSAGPSARLAPREEPFPL